MLPEPVEHECLACYLYRVIDQAGCQGKLDLLARYRDACAPRATAAERKSRMLGGYCDCEYLMNVVQPATTETMRAVDHGRDLVCQGVRRGSTTPCGNWLVRRGVQWAGGKFA